MDNKQIAKEVIDALGGRENVNSVAHCATPVSYTHLSFMRAVFTSGQQFFSLREALVLFAWTLVLLFFAPTIYEKRAFV